MSPWNPLLNCSRAMKIVLLSASLIASTVVIAKIRPVARDLSPNLVYLELANTPKKVDSILERWGDDGRERVRQAQALDNVFIVFYSSLLAISTFWLACVMGGDHEVGAIAGVWLGWGAWVAGLFDYLENYGIARELGGERGLWPLLTSSSSAIKWVLIAAVVGWLFFASAWGAGTPIFGRRS